MTDPRTKKEREGLEMSQVMNLKDKTSRKGGQSEKEKKIILGSPKILKENQKRSKKENQKRNRREDLKEGLRENLKEGLKEKERKSMDKNLRNHKTQKKEKRESMKTKRPNLNNSPLSQLSKPQLISGQLLHD